MRSEAPYLDYNTLSNTPYDTSEVEVETLTYAAVGHLTKNVSFAYNHSEGKELPARLELIYTGIGEPVDAQTDDIGLRFKFFDGKVEASANYYETSYENYIIRGALQNQINGIWRNVEDVVGEREPDVFQRGFLIDKESKGWEFSVVANPVRGLKIRANLTKEDTVQHNHAPELRGYINEYSDYWASIAAIDTDVQNSLSNLEDQFNLNVISTDGLAPRGSTEYKFSSWMNYEWNDGFLKGFGTGLGIRYSSKPIIGANHPEAEVREVFRGNGETFFDLAISYRRKLLKGKVNWTIQVNVSNVLDNDNIYPVVTDFQGNLMWYRFQKPRLIRFTNTFRF